MAPLFLSWPVSHLQTDKPTDQLAWAVVAEIHDSTLTFVGDS